MLVRIGQLPVMSASTTVMLVQRVSGLVVSSDGSYSPATGNQPSLLAKTVCRARASQNTGTETASMLVTRTPKSGNFVL